MRGIYIVLFSLLFVFGFVFLVSASDDSLYGGPARLAAMGNQEIVVEDNATIIDLNNLGFESAIFTRPAQSIIYLYPELDLMTLNEKETGVGTAWLDLYGGGTGASGAVNNGLLFFFSKDTALTIKPMLSVLSGGENFFGNVNKFLYYIPSGELSIAQRLGNNFSIALTGGYMRQDYNVNNANFGETDNYYDKIEYDLSFAMLPSTENDWTFALSAGNKTTSMLMPPTEIDNISSSYYLSQFSPLYIYNIHSYYKDTFGDEYYYDYNTNGFNISLGAASGKSGDMQVDVKAGLLADIAEEESSKDIENGVTTTQPAEKIFTNGIGTDSELDFRMKLSGATIGLKGIFDFVNGDTPNGTESLLLGTGAAGIENLLYAKGVAGINFGNKGFIIPIEFFYDLIQEYTKEGINETTSGWYDFGARLGNEIGLSDAVSLRFGLDYTLNANYEQDKTNGIITDEESPAGSVNNPWLMQLGYNAGIGFKSQANEFNIGFRIEPQWNNPNPYYNDYEKFNFKVVSDLKFYL